MKKLTEQKARRSLRAYFASRRVEKRGQGGEVIVDRNGEVLYEEKPSTVSGVALALGFADREELARIKDKKVKAVVDRALLKVEESAEERLFAKDTFNGAKLFLAVNFERWRDGAPTEPEDGTLGVCSVWAE